MRESLILLILLFSSALPAILVFVWLRIRKSTVTLPWFLASIVTGIISFIAAAIVQSFFYLTSNSGFGSILFDIFVRIALLEEASRIVTLIPLFLIVKIFRDSDVSFGAALGLTAGLGFALIENAYHGITDINIILLRLFTAAPIHGACGIRTAVAVFSFGKSNIKAIFCFITAVIIHGVYNLTIVIPNLPSVLAILIALTAFFASLGYIRSSSIDAS